MKRNGMKISQRALWTAYRAVRDNESWSDVRRSNPYTRESSRRKWEEVARHLYRTYK